MTDQDKRVEGLERRLKLAVDESDEWSILQLARDAIALARSLEADARRLDFIESQGNGMRWLSRQSVTRGYRLHNDKDGKHKTAREAIDAAIQEVTK